MGVIGGRFGREEDREFYLYDVYGTPDSTSSVGNPYLFTGKRYDPETGTYYFPWRTYSASLGRWMQIDPIGVVDGINLYEYAQSNPTNRIDPYGLCACPPGTLDEWDTPGSNGDWGVIRANWHFMFGGGGPIEFSGQSSFSAYVGTYIGGNLFKKVYDDITKKAKERAETMRSNTCLAIGFADNVGGYHYNSGGDYKMSGTIGNGSDDEYSNLSYNASCCLKKPCCSGNMVNISVKCKVEVTLEDLFGYFYPSDPYKKINKLGTPYWTIVHMFKDYDKKLGIPCN
jgi:RHS repeat-associated protein